MRLSTSAAFGAGLLSLFVHTAVAQSSDVTVLASRGVQSAIEELRPQAEHAIGHKLAIQYDSTTGQKERIAKGETFDVTILTTETIDELIKQGKLSAPTRAEIARCGVGVGVRAGASKPDISTPEAFKQTLLNAKSLTWAQDGASRTYIAKMLDTFGIAEQVKPKIQLEQGSVKANARVADGRTELVLTLVSEILPAPGVQLVGPFPDKVQNYVNFATAVNVQTSQATAGKAFIKFLKSPAAGPIFKAKGLEAR